MSGAGYCVFETRVGRCGVAWTERGLAGVSLPDAGGPAARARLSRRAGGASGAEPPPWVAALTQKISALLGGEPVDLSTVDLDDEAIPAFDAGVYAHARAIPAGRTATYGEIARALGDVSLSRRVGQALGRNPWPIVVPCHRVLAQSGASGGFSAPGGVETKLRLLAIEGAATSTDPLLFDTLPLAARARAQNA